MDEYRRGGMSARNIKKHLNNKFGDFLLSLEDEGLRQALGFSYNKRIMR